MNNFWGGMVQGAQTMWSNLSSAENLTVGDAVNWISNEYDQHVAPVTPWNESGGENVIAWASGEYNRLPESPLKTWVTDSYDQYVAPATPWDEDEGENAISWIADRYAQSDFKNTPIGGMFRHTRKKSSISDDVKISKRMRKNLY
jgi:hypothetical protein